jgi:N-acetyl-S-(2-succino)cysteine monooxygenase
MDASSPFLAAAFGDRAVADPRRLLWNDARLPSIVIDAKGLRIAGARGHWTIVGTPADVADQLEERFRAGGADGYNIMPASLPTSLNEFVELVIPELQRRGLFRLGYEGPTLRNNLELPRPAHPAAIARNETKLPSQAAMADS